MIFIETQQLQKKRNAKTMIDKDTVVYDIENFKTVFVSSVSQRPKILNMQETEAMKTLW